MKKAKKTRWTGGGIDENETQSWMCLLFKYQKTLSKALNRIQIKTQTGIEDWKV